MFQKPTLNDFIDRVRWHLEKASRSAKLDVAKVTREAAAHGALNSGRTVIYTVQAARNGLAAGIDAALGELKRAVRTTDLDKHELRQQTVQLLQNFLNEMKSVGQPDSLRTVASAHTNSEIATFDKDLAFAIRQFDVGLSSPDEPEEPRLTTNSINIGSMTGSTIQQGSPNANQMVEFVLEVPDAKASLAAFEDSLKTAALTDAVKHEIDADIATIKAQLEKSKPPVGIIQEAGKSLRNVVEGVAGGMLTPAVAAAAVALWTAIGLG